MAGRNSNFELLRTIAMLTILYHHFARQTKWDYGDTKTKDKDGHLLPEDLRYFTTARHLLIIYLGSMGKVGVHLFVLLSGYFMNTKQATLSSIVRLWFRVISWTWSILAIMYLFIRPIWWNDFKMQAFPTLTGQYWYVSTYIMIMCLSPILATTVRSLTQRQLAGTIAILLLSITVTRYFPITHRIHEYFYCRTILLFVLYLLGAYFRSYPKVAQNASAWFWLAIVGVLNVVDFCTLYYFSNYQSEYLAKNGRDNCDNMMLMASDYSPLALGMSVSLFLFARKLEMKPNRVVNWLGQMTFGVYITHENFLVRPYLWEHILKAKEYYTSPYFYIYMVVGPTSIYLACSVAEWLRSMAFAKLETLVVRHLSDWLRKLGDNLGDWLGMEESPKEVAAIA